MSVEYRIFESDQAMVEKLIISSFWEKPGLNCI